MSGLMTTSTILSRPERKRELRETKNESCLERRGKLVFKETLMKSKISSSMMHLKKSQKLK